MSEQKLRTNNDVLRIVALVLGDVIVFLIFALIGRRSHGEVAGIATLLLIIQTALPFLAGWFVVSPFIGAFRREVLADPRMMAKRTFFAWLGSWPVAMILRGLFVDHAIPPWTFWLVAFISNTILLSLWRIPFAWINARRNQRSAHLVYEH
ncbi:MAG TPA: DUF3054 domain-containing protein [Dictyobacter sp.]|jgi:hypothetical protein|nr:DUF3054 domain-containing protein [Dictyobacter sp.]